MNEPGPARQADACGERLLVERAQHGDAIAFTSLVERYQQALAGYLWRLMGGSDVAIDLTHEAFVRAWCALPDTQPQLHFRAWLFRIATNLAHDQCRRRRRIRWLPLDAAASVVAADTADMPFQADNHDPCRLTLARLRPRDRTMLLLCAVEDVSYAEAASVIGVSPEAARKQFTRAKERFRRLYLAISGAAAE